jgi:hypothetical protein
VLISSTPSLLANGGDAPMKMGPEPLAGGGDNTPVEEEDPKLLANGGDTAVEMAHVTPANGGGAPIEVVGVGDNAECVFLELGNNGVIVYLHLRSKKVEKVY